MTTRQPFTLTVYDKDFYRLGLIGRPSDVAVTVRHNAAGTATVSVRDDDPRALALTSPGARLTVAYDRQPGLLLSGYVQELAASESGTRRFVVVDDWQLLADTLGWPVPTAALTAQTVAYDTYTGPAETVVKDVVTANAVGRLGLPLTVATDQGRGATITCSFRMHPLADRLFPAVDQAGIGVSVLQRLDVRQGDGRYRSPGLLLDCYEPSTYPRTLSDLSGALLAWKYTGRTVTATRIVSGAQGEAENRDFAATVLTDRESTYGRTIERFVDARDTGQEPVAANRREEALTAGAATAGIAVTLAETPSFAYGQAVRVGDFVPVEAGGLVVTDVLREATLAWSASDGFSVTPTVGEQTVPLTAVPRALAALGRVVRNLTAGR